jgi:hypothetical protein
MQKNVTKKKRKVGKSYRKVKAARLKRRARCS